MNLIAYRDIVAMSPDTPASIYRNSFVLHSNSTSWILTGQNAHLLLPFHFFDLLPRAILTPAEKPSILEGLPNSLQIYVTEVNRTNYVDDADFTPLSRAISFPVPRKEIGGRWFFLESGFFATIQPQQDFVLLTSSPTASEVHIKFRSQSYALSYKPEEDDLIWGSLKCFFPATGDEPNLAAEKNVFSVYLTPKTNRAFSMEQPRFPRFLAIRKIDDDELDLSRLSSMPTKFNPLGLTQEAFKPKRDQELPRRRGRGI